MSEQKRFTTTQRNLILVLVGLGAGFLSGMFGVGGGVVIVPALIAVGFAPRLASGTSLTTILPLSAVGVVSYALQGDVAWAAAGLLAVGALAGAQVGTWLLSRIEQKWLQVAFAVFMFASVAMLFIAIPSRDSHIVITIGSAVGLVATGLATGMLSGLLGVGGGVIVVPALMLLFGASDLVAKGTSLALMIPTALTGTIANLARKNLDVTAALIVGLAACCTTVLGSMVAHRVSPFVATVTFAAFLSLVALNLLWKALRKAK